MKKMNLFSAKTAIKSALVASVFMVSAAYATTIQWTGPTDFDNASISFAPVQASHMELIDAYGNFSEYHSHGGLSYGVLNLLLNNVWTNVYTGSVSNGADFFLNGLAVDFASSKVTGAQWTTPTPQFNSYHGFYNVSLNFTDPNSVPEPTTVALLGLGLLGFAASRHKSAKNKNA